MNLNDLKPAPNSKQRRRRKARGLGSGRGKTAGRGQKGQKSRSGFSQGHGWEGGKSRLIMRLPKRGFTRQGDAHQIVNVGDLNIFDDGASIDAQVLADRGLVRRGDVPVKLLGDGDLEVVDLTIDVAAWSAGALAAVKAKGGSIVNAAPEAADAEPTADTASDDEESTADGEQG